MKRLRAMFLRAAGLLRWKRHEAEMDEEMRAHLDELIERNLARGMSLEDARHAALRKFGGVEQAKEGSREARRMVWAEQVLQDVRYAARQLRKAPGFTAVAALSLALGIGANTAVFTALDRAWLRPLPVRNPDELVRFQWLSGPQGGTPSTTEDEMDRLDPATGRRTGTVFSLATFEQFRGHHPLLAEVFAFTRPPAFTLEIDREVMGESGQVVSGNYHVGLGVVAQRGRTLLPEDDRPSADPVTVISHRCWQRLFGGDADVVGKTIRVNRKTLTIVGVLPAGFVDPIAVFGHQDFTFPLAMLPLLDPGAARKAKPDYWWVRIMGRLQPGVTLAQAAASLEPGLQASARDGLTIKGDPPLLRANPGGHGLAESRRERASPLLILMGMVGLVLLAACANVANLLLARGVARRREIAVRLALGASRGRLIRQLLAESLLLAALGAGLGVLLAAWGGALLPVVNPGSAEGIDWRVLGFTTGVAALTGVCFGLAPAWRATRIDLTAEFQGGMRQLGRGGRSRLGRALLVLQVALSLVLLVGAGLFLRTLRNLRAVDIGFERERLMLFGVDAQTAGYQRAQFAELHRRIAERIGALPGVDSVTFSANPVLSNSAGYYGRFTLPGAAPGSEQSRAAALNQVGPDFFATFGIPLTLGRTFTAQDSATAPRVAVVNQTLVDRYLPGDNPIGRRIRIGGGELEIVGVARDIRQIDLRQPTPPTAYVPFAQDVRGEVHFAVRTTARPETLVAALRTAMREIEPNLPLGGVRTQEQQIEELLEQEQAFARLSGCFGGLALVLACVGLYGLMSYAVLRRTGEFGLRLALGALPGAVLRLVLRESLGLVALGALLGLTAAGAATRLIAAMLFGLPPGDPLTYGTATLLLFAVALAACWLPARRAAKVDPMVALRAE